MYSILIKQSEKNYTFLCNDDGSVFQGTMEATKEKVVELLDKYPLGKLTVVHNTTITTDFTIQDVE